MPRRLLIVEEALKDFSGHWYEYNKAVVAFHRAAGVDVTVAAHRDVRPEIRTELGALPYFPYTNWDNIYASPHAAVRYVNILRHNWRVYSALDQLFAQSEPFDCVFVPTVVIYHFLAWLRLIPKYRNRKFKRVVLFIRNNAGNYPRGATRPTFKTSARILAKVLQRFRKFIESGTLCLATDSGRLSDQYAELCGLRPAVFPHPSLTRRAAPPPPRAPDAPVVMSCFGPPRYEKGADIFQDAIRLAQRRYPNLNVRFTLQWNSDVYAPDGTLIPLDEELRRSGRVDYVRAMLTSEEYERRFQGSDCIVLPYRREEYCTRISGVAVEAATAGLPMIYTNDTWTADAVAQYGAGIGVAEENPERLAEAIFTMATEIDAYRAQAAARAPLALDYHSDERFLKCLWGE
jgi:glycosyltransferase involved in cell wall biosynthesis